ncbi:hypothetical protein EVJ58_g878 [Rhodofomes roseus]|uniref:Cytochrome b-c1 complex subunit 2, mitochondrial n=1 Tax=Rhodofomes roseus TaxID=34475 RepID=A0A4Y9Z209_9APHY|nr:hypothetical protein EVJ58_g878 [Rhodofomes roseus]
MLASRSSAARSASRLARNFATVVDTAGVKVAAVDNGEPTSAVTFLVKAGSRFESKPGVAHALKGFAFKSTEKRSFLGTIREAELYGGVLSTSLTREHLALTAEFLRGDEPLFVDIISSFIKSAKYTRHELDEYVVPDVKAYAQNVFTPGNLAVLGTGIDAATLQKLVEQSLGSLSSASAPTSSPSSYFGGETRIEAHGAPETIFIGLGTTGAPSAELAVLSAHLDPTPSVKWSKGTSPIAAGVPEGISVKTVLLPYSDAALYGILIQGESTEGVKAAGKAAVAALKASGDLKGDDLKKAVAKAKFAAASALDGRDNLVFALGAQAFGSPASLDSTISNLDKVNASAFSKVRYATPLKDVVLTIRVQAATSFVKAKPTYVAIGDIKRLPYADELGL